MLDLTIDDSLRSALARLVVGNLDPIALPESQLAQVIQLALAQGLGPMLLWAVRGRVPISEDELPWQALVNAARQQALYFALLENTRQRLNDALTQDNIPAIWLKGIALAHTVYPEPYLRPMLDLDVLVPYAQREQARQIAEGMGFQPPPLDYLTILDAPEVVLNHDQLLGGPGKKVCLELHFRLLGREGHRLLPQEEIAWFWEQTQTLGSVEKDFTILKPEVHLLYLCAHALLQHGETHLNMLQLLDLHLLAINETLDWRLIVDKAITLRWSYAVGRALDIAVAVYDTPVPDWVFLELQAHRSANEKPFPGKGLRPRVSRWDEWKQIYRSTQLHKRARLIWVTIFPPSKYLRELYKVLPSRSVVPYYIYRWWDAGREIARSLVGCRKWRA